MHALWDYVQRCILLCEENLVKLSMLASMPNAGKSILFVANLQHLRRSGVMQQSAVHNLVQVNLAWHDDDLALSENLQQVSPVVMTRGLKAAYMEAG